PGITAAYAGLTGNKAAYNSHTLALWRRFPMLAAARGRPPCRERERPVMTFQSPNAEFLPRHPLIIGDSRETGGSGEVLAHIYPGTGAVTREIRMANAADVDRAVAAARAAFPA